MLGPTSELDAPRTRAFRSRIPVAESAFRHPRAAALCYARRVITRRTALLFLAALALCAAAALAACQRKAAPAGPLPQLGAVPEFSLTDQNAQPFGRKELLGRPHLVSFMFTRCPSVCPRVLAKKKEVSKAALAAGKDLAMVSISIDGENDTPAVLQKYARDNQLDLGRWSLLTGDARQVAEHAERSFKIAVSGELDEKKPDYGLTHGSHLVLIDAQGQIRGYYASSDSETTAQLVSDLARL